MNGYLLRSLLAGVLLALATTTMGQTVPAPARLSEVEQLRLQLLIERQRRLAAEYDAATAKLLAEETALVQHAFAAHNVDSSQFKLNPDTGEFIAAPAATTQK